MIEKLGCELCRDPDGGLCLPDYGLMPHEHPLKEESGSITIGPTKFIDEVPDNYAPICGDDGITYENACNGCSSGNIETYTLEECVTEVKRSTHM